MEKFQDFSLKVKYLIVMLLIVIMSISTFSTIYYINALQMHGSHKLQIAERQITLLELIAAYSHSQESASLKFE